MKKRKVLLILMVVFLSFFFYQKDDGGVKDNYYNAINKTVIRDNLLEEDEYNWSYFMEAQEQVDNDIDKIVEQIVSDDTILLDDKEINVIQSIYYKAIDMDKRDKDGLLAIDPYLDRVWEVSSIDELIDVIIVLEKELSIDILTNVQVMEDYKDNSKNIIYFIPVTFAFGASSDYIINDDYMAYTAYLRRACVQLWKAYGKDAKEAREVVSRVFSFYEGVSEHSKLSSELEDIISYYEVVTERDILDIFANIDGEYFSKKGLAGNDVYSMVDEEQYKYLDTMLTNDNLSIWKEVIVTKILSSYAYYASSEYVKIVDDLNKALGVEEEKSQNELAVDLIDSLFSSEIDSIYAEMKLSNMNVTEIMNMVSDIKNVYVKRLKNNEWLSKDAIENALVKLDNMDVIVGIDEDLVSYDVASKLEISDDSLLEDVIKIQKLICEEELARLDSGKKRELISQTVVNAYYQPLSNSIVIPVAFFELVDVEENYYKKLGSLGMILAHEIIHGFDGNGSKFDEVGNLNSWWNEEDKDKFLRLQDKVSSYYSKYEVLNGKYIDGNKTVNENIADLGAIACISDLALEKGASDDEIKAMFSSFAGLWASNESEEYMELLLLQDVHSPNQFRVNATLSSNDLFYSVYDIYPWDKMWLSKEERVVVW